MSTTTKAVSINISKELGKVSGAYTLPKNKRCILTLAHGAGANMHHDFMVKLAGALAAHDIATLRFNFPFMENKKGRPDTPAVAHQAIAAAMQTAHKAFPSLPLFAAGKSFGGRMSSQYLAAHPETKAAGLIFYGFPLHPAGKPSTERAKHLDEVHIPMLFLQGTKDELAKWDLIEATCKALPSSTLVKIEGADHSFKAGKKDILSQLVAETVNWIDTVLAG